MTKMEVKCIELIIDKYTVERDGGYYGNDYKEIPERNITKIKNEIRELAEVENGTK